MIKPPRWNVQPTVESRELWRDLIVCWPLNEGAGGNVVPFGPKTSLFPVNTLAGGAVRGRGGVDTSSTTTGTAIECGTADPISDEKSFSMMFAGFLNILPGASDFAHFITKRDTGGAGNQRWSWFITDNVDSKLIVTGGNESIDTIFTPTLGYHVWIVTYDGTTGRIYEDGVEGATDTPNFTFDTKTASGVRLGNAQTDAGENFDGVIDMAAMWNRPLTPAEIRLLGTDPYVLLRPPRHLLPVLVPGERPLPRILIRSP